MPLNEQKTSFGRAWRMLVGWRSEVTKRKREGEGWQRPSECRHEAIHGSSWWPVKSLALCIVFEMMCSLSGRISPKNEANICMSYFYFIFCEILFFHSRISIWKCFENFYSCISVCKCFKNFDSRIMLAFANFLIFLFSYCFEKLLFSYQRFECLKTFILVSTFENVLKTFYFVLAIVNVLKTFILVSAFARAAGGIQMLQSPSF